MGYDIPSEGRVAASIFQQMCDTKFYLQAYRSISWANFYIIINTSIVQYGPKINTMWSKDINNFAKHAPVVPLFSSVTVALNYSLLLETKLLMSSLKSVMV